MATNRPLLYFSISSTLGTAVIGSIPVALTRYGLPMLPSSIFFFA